MDGITDARIEIVEVVLYCFIVTTIVVLTLRWKFERTYLLYDTLRLNRMQAQIGLCLTSIETLPSLLSQLCPSLYRPTLIVLCPSRYCWLA